MALITCPECGRGISDHCGSCPNCGYPISPESNTTTIIMTEKKENVGHRLTKPVVNFKVKSWDISMNPLQIISFVCAVCSFIMLFPEITFNRINFEISSLEISQVIGESFLYTAEGVLPALPYLVVLACVASITTAIIGNKTGLLWMLVSLTYGGICAWVIIGATKVTEISANRKYCAIYTRTEFAFALIVLVAITTIASVVYCLLLKKLLKHCSHKNKKEADNL